MLGYIKFYPAIFAKRLKGSTRVQSGATYRLWIQEKPQWSTETRAIKIVDDNGNAMEPSLHLDDTSDYWEIVFGNKEPLSTKDKYALRDLMKKDKGHIWKKDPIKNKPRKPDFTPEYYHEYICTATNHAYRFIKHHLYYFCVETEKMINHIGEPIRMNPAFWDSFTFHSYGNTDPYEYKQYDEPMQQETIMAQCEPMEITNPTLINGEDAEKISDADLISYIKRIQEDIKKLEALPEGSKRVPKLIKQHNANIKTLMSIFDKRG